MDEDLTYKPPFLISKSRFDIPDLYLSKSPLNEVIKGARSTLCTGGRSALFTLTPDPSQPSLCYPAIKLHRITELDPDGDIDTLVHQLSTLIQRLPPEIRNARLEQITEKLNFRRI